MIDLPQGRAGELWHHSIHAIIDEDELKSILVVLLLLLLAAGCKDFPGADGRYATGGRGGWDNFRAEAPAGTTAPAP